MTRLMKSLVMLFGLFAMQVHAQQSAFQQDGYISGFGPFVRIPGDTMMPKEVEFKVAFDTGVAAAPGTVNKTMVAAARFLNMHVDAGISPDKIDLVVVIHGSAGADVGTAAYYEDQHLQANASAPLVSALIEKGVKFIVCGQSAAFYGMSSGDFMPGVETALSAMTAHALLQQQGFTLNPF